jgi:hypothetical protein
MPAVRGGEYHSSGVRLLAAVRNFARTAVVVLFLMSAASFVSYVGIRAGLNDPILLARLHPFAADAAMRRQASFVLYLGGTTGLVATMSFIILVVADRRATGRTHGEDADDGAGMDACPECHEPINGLEAVCRECGHRFGPGSWSRRE